MVSQRVGQAMKQPFVLRTQENIDRLFQAINSLTPDEGIHQVVISPYRSTRTLQQNAKAHAMLTDISKQVEWKGMKLSVLVWKRLCTAAMLRELGEAPMLVPSLDGHGIEVIYEKTSTMGVEMMGNLIEFMFCFGAENDVKWSYVDD